MPESDQVSASVPVHGTETYPARCSAVEALIANIRVVVAGVVAVVDASAQLVRAI